MSIPDDILMAYVDGELSAEERVRVEAAMQRDATVARRVAEQKKLRGELRAAFDGVLREPVPERLLAAARGETAGDGARRNQGRGMTDSADGATSRSTVGAASRADDVPAGEPRGSISDFEAAARARNAAREVRDAARVTRASRRWSWPEWGAIAASLVIGVIVAQFAMRSPDGAPFTAEQGQLLAQGDLARTLSEQLASAQTAGADTSVGVSFRTKDGGYCRSFTMRSSSTVGLACREGDGWRLDVLARSDAQPGEYTQASSALPAAVLSAIEQRIEGEPLDAAAEARAKESDWRRAPAQ